MKWKNTEFARTVAQKKILFHFMCTKSPMGIEFNEARITIKLLPDTKALLSIMISEQSMIGVTVIGIVGSPEDDSCLRAHTNLFFFAGKAGYEVCHPLCRNLLDARKKNDSQMPNQ